jgi:thiamine pyrophosphokinase
MTKGEAETGYLGIAFIGGEGPPPEKVRAVLAEAAESAPLTAAADSGLLAAEESGIRPRWIIGDMDSLGGEGERRLSAYNPDRILRYPADKDYTDTELALSLLEEKGCTRIWLIGGGGGRIDHLFALRSLFEREKPPERWISSGGDIRCVEAPGELVYADPAAPEKPLSPVSIFPLGKGPWKAESSGLKWPLEGLPWSRGFFAVSNAAPQGGFTIKALEGRFMVILPAA